MNLDNSLQENVAMLGFIISVVDLVAGPSPSQPGFEARNHLRIPARFARDTAVEIP